MGGLRRNTAVLRGAFPPPPSESIPTPINCSTAVFTRLNLQNPCSNYNNRGWATAEAYAAREELA